MSKTEQDQSKTYQAEAQAAFNQFKSTYSIHLNTLQQYLDIGEYWLAWQLVTGQMASASRSLESALRLANSSKRTERMHS